MELYDELMQKTLKACALDQQIKDVTTGLERFGALQQTSGFVSAVNRAVETAIGTATKHRKEIDADMRATMQRARGMLNQLVQVLNMSRSR